MGQNPSHENYRIAVNRSTLASAVDKGLTTKEQSTTVVMANNEQTNKKTYTSQSSSKSMNPDQSSSR